MINEMKEAINIAVILISLAVFLTIISYFSSLSKEAVYAKSIVDTNTAFFTSQRQVYKYNKGISINNLDLEDEEDNEYEDLKNAMLDNTSVYTFTDVSEYSVVLTGDDIYKLMQEYPNEYNYYIREFEKEIDTEDYYNVSTAVNETITYISQTSSSLDTVVLSTDGVSGSPFQAINALATEYRVAFIMDYSSNLIKDVVVQEIEQG